MNRANQTVIKLIQRILRVGMFIVPVLMISIPLAVAKQPEDKDRERRMNRIQPPTPVRSVDSGNKPDSPRISSPQRPVRSDPPQPVRTFRNDNPPAPRVNPPVRANPNPPVASGPSPSVGRNFSDTQRAFRGGNPTGNAMPPVTNRQRDVAPPTARSLPSANTRPADTARAFRDSNQTGRTNTPTIKNDPPKPAITRPAPAIVNKPSNTNVAPPNQGSGVKSFDRPTNKTPNSPSAKTYDRPANSSLDRGRTDRLPQQGGMKKTDNVAPRQDNRFSPANLKPKGDVNRPNFDQRDAFKPNRFPGGRLDQLPSPPNAKGGSTAIDNRPGKKPGDGPKNFLPGRKPGDKPNDITKDERPGRKPGEGPKNFLPGRKPGDKPDDISKDDRPGRKAGEDSKDFLPGRKPGDKPKDITKDDRPGKRPGDDKDRGPSLRPSDRPPQQVRDEDLKKYHKPFEERVKSGELEKITKGEFAKKVNLAEQYKLKHKGDVARQLELHKHTAKIININTVNNATIKHLHGIHPKHGFYYGRISPIYANHCFKRPYFGYSFFAGPCWYPHWNPWVKWSWRYRCNPYWDPRPLWCRPIYYEPYIVWNYWTPPVWQPLPVLSVGTWVDVKPMVVEPEQYDLQLLAVRMVDPGHPEENLGPRFRVWFRNNSARPITDPFAVMLFASNDKRFGQELPKSGVRVTSIEAGDTQSVDIRLPIEVATMNRDANGQPAPFEFLHFFVDANREVNDTNMANNGVLVGRDEMLPVDPAAFEIDPLQSQPGGEMILAGEGLGPQPGKVLLQLGDQEVEAEIVGWYDLGVKFNLPDMGIDVPTEAEVIVVRGDGAAANPLKITLLPGQGGPLLEMPVGP